MQVDVHIDRPTSPLINNVSQEFTGWLSSNALADQALELTIDDVPVQFVRHRREDVEQLMPGQEVAGWTFYLDPASTYGNARRTLELKIRLGDSWCYSRHFLKSKNLMLADRASPLFFMHIPKTAGTALRQFTDFAFDSFPSMLLYGDAPGVSSEQASGPLRDFTLTRELIFGHQDFDFARRLVPNPKVVTVFRDPQELTRSYLNYVATPIPQFLDNPLTRHVCGLSYTEPFGLIGVDHLEIALGIVNQNFCILQNDRLQEFADQVVEAFGLSPFLVPRINDFAANGKIEYANLPVDVRYDMQLYAACRDRRMDFLGFLNA